MMKQDKTKGQRPSPQGPQHPGPTSRLIVGPGGVVQGAPRKAPKQQENPQSAQTRMKSQTFLKDKHGKDYKGAK